jgi:hypothetical protein
MVAKSEKTQAEKKRVRVGKLQINKETVKDLSGTEGKDVQGGKKGGYIYTARTVCVTQIYAGGPCGFNSQLDCI